MKAPPGRPHKSLLLITGAGMALCLTLFAGLKVPALGQSNNLAEVRFLDVGQGDATAVRLPSGRLLLIDGGESVENWDSAERVLVPFLREAKKKVFDVVFVTHFHSDHVGGVMKLLYEGRVKRLMVGVSDTTTALARLTYEAARRNKTEIVFLRKPGTILREEGIELAILRPSGSTSFDTSFASINDSSMVLVLRAKLAQFVMTGDAGPKTMDYVAEFLEPGKLTVLKTPHHGGKGTISNRLIERAKPGYVVFSVGRNNRFGHPAGEVVQAYEATGARIFRTDRDGCVSFRVDGDSLGIRTADPSMGLPMIQKAKSRRAARRLTLFALLSGTPFIRK